MKRVMKNADGTDNPGTTDTNKVDEVQIVDN